MKLQLLSLVALVYLLSLSCLAWLGGCQTEQVVSENCFTNLPLGSNVCIKVTSHDCFQLTGTISLNGQQLFSENIPVSTILQAYQLEAETLHPTVCRNFGGLENFQCHICSTAQELLLNGDNLHYCGSMTLNCTTPFNTLPISQTIHPDCVDIKNCAIYGCANSCSNAGTCNSIGMCKCNPEHYGLDCSFSIQDNCIQSSQFDKTCWTAEFPDCNTIDLKVASTQRGELVNQRAAIRGGTLQLLPCTQLSGNLNCEVCVNAEDLSVVNDELKGYPVVRTSCNNIPVSDYKIPSVTIAKSPKLVCDSTPPTSTSPASSSTASDSSTGKTVLMVFLGLLVVVGLVGGGYFLYTKRDYFSGPPQPDSFLGSDDDTPLKPDDIEDDLDGSI